MDDKTEFWGPKGGSRRTDPKGLKNDTMSAGYEIKLSLDKSVALDIGSHFAIREGGKTVGSGVITELVL